MWCVAGIHWPGAVLAEDAGADAPQAGDKLAAAEGQGSPVALMPTDLTVGGPPRTAYPMTPSGVLRDGSRLNKILLLRVPLESLASGDPAQHSAGVLAFSAICTHQGCVVSSYLAPEHSLMCPCHFSKFDVQDAGRVVGGPAPRSLPTLPLRLEGNQLLIAGSFSAAPGVKRSA